MKHEVIPAIIADNIKDLNEKIAKVSAYVDWLQLDVMDGQLVDNVTWYNPQDLKDLDQSLIEGKNLEAHLMIWQPEKTIDQWLKIGLKRIYFHYEATHRKAELLEAIRLAGIKAGIALDIVTPISFIDQYIKLIDAVMIMTVKPGRGGQSFKPEMLNKVKQLRQLYPDLDIAVDGGINLETGKQSLEAGANILCAGSYILNAQNTEQVIINLKNIQ